MAEPLSHALELAAATQAGRVDVAATVETALARAKQHQEKYRAFITLDEKRARADAARVQARIKNGEKLPLAGVPYAVKDLFEVAGLPTTCGAKTFQKRIAKADCDAVRKLSQAGAVLLGTLNMHECAFGFTGENPTFGDCRNPWNAERVAGGSSSGSAVAVALDICPFTLGSDTGGSTRMPGALCNLIGLKPTYGRISRQGVLPLSWTLDHVGILARTAVETAAVLKILAGHDPADDASSEKLVPDYASELPARLNGLRLGIQHDWFFADLEPDVAAATTAAIKRLETLGARVVEIKLPYLEEVVGAHRAVIFPEATAFHQPFLKTQPDDYSPGIRTNLEGGLFFPSVDYINAQRFRRIVRKAWAAEFAKIDCLVSPTTPVVATKFGQETAPLPGGDKPLVRAYLDLTLPFNFSGHPALSMPCGFSQDGLPIGLQLVGKPFAEATLLRVAHQYQMNTDWHRKTPKA